MGSVQRDEITALGAAEIARRVAVSAVSCCEVVEAHIRRIQAVNPRLNALVVPLFDRARAEARTADAACARGEPLGRLHGVPFSVKDFFEAAGTPSTLGIPSRVGRRAAADSPLVARLRRAGGILLGKTNVPQVGLMIETDNPLYGRTNNPWDLGRTPGGSTGGEAALIAAGGSPLGLGSDGGGSVRQPCHCCGIHGLKPTGGRLTTLGSYGGLPFPTIPSRWMQPAPMARRVEDLALVMSILATPNPSFDHLDPLVAPVPWHDPAALAIAGLRVGFYTDDGHFPASPALRRAVEESAQALRGLGAAVEPFSPPEVGEAIRIYTAHLYVDGLDFVRPWVRGGLVDWRTRTILRTFLVPGIFRHPLAWALEQAGQRWAARIYRDVPRRRSSLAAFWRLVDQEDAYRTRFLNALDGQELDALICPPSAVPAVRHGGFLAGPSVSYTLLYNVLGMPAGVVAATRVRPGEESDRPFSRDVVERAARAAEADSAGLPVGVQVAARHWREDVVLAVMAALEGHFAGRPDYPAYPR
jgi:fatty acid amide hydrolase